MSACHIAVRWDILFSIGVLRQHLAVEETTSAFMGAVCQTPKNPSVDVKTSEMRKLLALIVDDNCGDSPLHFAGGHNGGKRPRMCRAVTQHRLASPGQFHAVKATTRCTLNRCPRTTPQKAERHRGLQFCVPVLCLGDSRWIK